MKKHTYLIALSSLCLFSCGKDPQPEPDGSGTTDTNTYTTPTTYAFTNDAGESTVSYSGQTARMNMLSEIGSYVKGNISTQTALSASKLKEMFSNSNAPFTDAELNASTKQLESKCFATDVALFKAHMDKLEAISQDYNATAAEGQAGIMTTGSSTYLMDENGVEPFQIIEKGLMGAVFFYQATGYYLANINGDDNAAPAEGKPYTTMEHHFDEAYGYFGAPVDFGTAGFTYTSGSEYDRFWVKYANKRDGEIGCNAAIMDAFKKGRAALTAKNYGDRDAAIKIIKETWEKVSAAQAVHYLEGTLTALSSQDMAKAFHELSEAYAFILNLKYAPEDTRKLTVDQVETLLNSNIGSDFWKTTTSGITMAITTLNDAYGL